MATIDTDTISVIELFDKAKTVDEWHRVRASMVDAFDAEEELYELLDRHPAGKADHQFKRGMTLWLLGRHGDAAELLKGVADKAGVADYFAGLSLKEIEAYTEAESFLRRAIEKGQVRAHLAMADIAIVLGNVPEAHDILKTHGPACQKISDYWYLTGLVEDLNGRTKTAVEHYEKALGFEAKHPGAMFRLAYHADLVGDDEQAIDYYQQLRNSFPVHVHTLINLGVIFEDRGEYERAVNCYRTVLNRYPNHERAQLFYKDAEASRSMYYDEDKIKEEDKRAVLLRTQVTEFELSVRSRNCLSRMKIETLGDLIKKTEQELLSYKNFGETSLQEIKTILTKKGLRLGMQPGEAGTALIEQPTQEAQEEVLSKSIADLNFSVRVRKVMEKLNIHTLGDLTKTKESELTSLKNFGKTSLAELKKKLAENNVTLAPE